MAERDRKSLILLLLFGTLLYSVLFFSSATSFVKDRRDLNTPLTSWSKLSECVALKNLKRDPFDGDSCHQPPLLVLAASYILKFPDTFTNALFLISTILTTLSLYFIAKIAFQENISFQRQQRKVFAADIDSLLLQDNNCALMVATVYLFNPFTIGSCLSQSLGVLYDLVLVVSLYSALNGRRFTSMVTLAFSTYASLYPVMLLFPIGIICIQKMNGRNIHQLNISSSLLIDVIKIVFIFSLSLIIYLLTSFYITKSWLFISGTYGTMLTVSDLSPNVGLFWYFFQEMFEHFRMFFLVIFHLIALFFTFPLTVMFRKHPVFLLYVLSSAIVVFKSYPSFGDLSLVLAFLPLWRHCHQYMNSTLVVFFMFVFSSILSPIFYYLWIYAGAGNANFFYAITLVYNTGQVLLLGDSVVAFLKYQYILHNGKQPLLSDGQLGKFIFK